MTKGCLLECANSIKMNNRKQLILRTSIVVNISRLVFANNGGYIEISLYLLRMYYLMSKVYL